MSKLRKKAATTGRRAKAAPAHAKPKPGVAKASAKRANATPGDPLDQFIDAAAAAHQAAAGVPQILGETGHETSGGVARCGHGLYGPLDAGQCPGLL